MILKFLFVGRVVASVFSLSFSYQGLAHVCKFQVISEDPFNNLYIGIIYLTWLYFFHFLPLVRKNQSKVNHLI